MSLPGGPVRQRCGHGDTPVCIPCGSMPMGYTPGPLRRFAGKTSSATAGKAQGGSQLPNPWPAFSPLSAARRGAHHGLAQYSAAVTSPAGRGCSPRTVPPNTANQMFGVNSIFHNNLLPKSCQKSPRRLAGGFRRFWGGNFSPRTKPAHREHRRPSRQTGRPGLSCSCVRWSPRRNMSAQDQTLRLNRAVCPAESGLWHSSG